MQCTVRGTLDFETAFRALEVCHRPPLKWQTRLYERLVRGDIPGVCHLPTGLGKTSVIPIWLIALCGGACGTKLPRRLVYIVNRRTVVDQATDDATRILRRIQQPANAAEPNGMACCLREGLARLAGDPSATPLAVSTIRGELADNGEWKKNPARPAIIIGTIDMIGSKLLFSGYGDGRYGRAHHAGLIGQDALIVHDEAHLSPAFNELLRGIAAEQARCSESRPIRVMSLSATTRGGGAESNGGTDGGSLFGIEDEDLQDPMVSQRLKACKTLTIVDADRRKFGARIAGEALRLGKSPSRVLVYVRSPNDVATVAEAIKKELGDGGGTRVARLTGTIRGKERDELAESEVFCAFKAGADRSSPLKDSLYLVSTSAGEVGADLDADHLVCDLTTLDSMAQRFGRVNRLGGTGRSAEIVVVMECATGNKKKATGKDEDSEENAGAEVGKKEGGRKKAVNDYEAAVDKTGEILRRIAANGGDVSPDGLRQVMGDLSAADKQAAFSPVPTILPATDILFDHWSLTSIAGEMPGRPEVGPYLHGVAEWEPPETHVAWRADIALLAGAGGVDDDGQPVPCSRDDLAEVFDAFPLRSVETLRDRTDRVQEQLQALAKRLKNAGTGEGVPLAAGEEVEPEMESEMAPEVQGENTPVPPATIPADPWVVLMRGGSAEWVRLSDIAPADSKETNQDQRRLAFATIVLPVEAGGLKDGMLAGDEPAPADARSLDVAEVVRDGVRARQRMRDGRPLLGGDAIVGVSRATISLAPADDEDAEQSTLEYRVAKGQEREPGERVRLDQHNKEVASVAEQMGRALGLDDALVTALRLAGKWHDAGKSRVVWQRYAGNWDAQEKRLRDGHSIAKSERYGHWKQLAGYRHEFGSLLDSVAADEIRKLDKSTRDLVLHLIAAHHGWARPHFEPRHFDPGEPSWAGGTPRPTAGNERLAVEVMQRFGHLQRRFGRWGLAWLESILRCADAAASESPTPADNGAGTGSRQEGTPGGAA
ncbi:MAG: type I-U CRISPR-associated helicase/endonuclease Cas3 [Phycisphaerae bacterium]|nr:type I-U CRISPR-associated helicase/endonuclease Cas3 [Phycisphaerae bacterium]